MAKRLSVRYGYRRLAQEIAVRENAPDHLKYYITLISEDVGMSPDRDAKRRLPCAPRPARSFELIRIPRMSRTRGERPDFRMCLVQGL